VSVAGAVSHKPQSYYFWLIVNSLFVAFSKAVKAIMIFLSQVLLLRWSIQNQTRGGFEYEIEDF